MDTTTVPRPPLPRLLAWAPIVWTIAVILAVVLQGEQLHAKSTDAEIIEHFANRTRLLGAWVCYLVANIAFLLSVRALYILGRSRSANRPLLNVGAVAGTLVVVVDVVADSVLLSPAVRVVDIANVEATRSTLATGRTLVSVVMLCLAAFAIAQGVMLAQTSALNRFVAWFAIALGACSLVLALGSLAGVDELAVGTESFESVVIGYLGWFVAVGVSLLRNTTRPISAVDRGPTPARSHATA